MPSGKTVWSFKYLFGENRVSKKYTQISLFKSRPFYNKDLCFWILIKTN